MLENTKFDIVGRRKIWYLISLLIIIPGIVCNTGTSRLAGFAPLKHQDKLDLVLILNAGD